MDKQFRLAIFIGRFQPLHKGHFQTLLTGTKLADKLLVLVGSASDTRTIDNPFSFEEREQMILESRECTAHNIKVRPIKDYPSDAVWANRVDDIVKGFETNDSKIVLIGDHTDPASSYLKMFNWPVIGNENVAGVHAAAIRSLYFSSYNTLKQIESMVPVSTFRFLENFQKDPTWVEYDSLKSELQGFLWKT